jgi:copper chaperone CopZ
MRAEGTLTVTRTVLYIMGMREAACVQRLTRALEAVKGVRNAEVSLFRSRAQVVHGTACGADELVTAIKRAGYAAAKENEGAQR